MLLSSLFRYKDIVIQCHDYPDADAIASGFALYRYFINNGIACRLVYSGEQRISRSGLRKMTTLLDIPIRYVREIRRPELLITVDCQYGEGNITGFAAENIAIIDHHEKCVESGELVEIQSMLGSCSTLIYLLLKQEGFDVNSDRRISTALYYGLCTDTNDFSDIITKADMEMLRYLEVDYSIIEAVKNASANSIELEMSDNLEIDTYRVNDIEYAIVGTKISDPNVLGLINDRILKQYKLKLCVVYNELNSGYKLSVRCPGKQASAHDIAVYITRHIGNGGGHKSKAGGIILKDELEQSEISNIRDYLRDRIEKYILREKTNTPGVSGKAKFIKPKLKVL